MTTRCEQLFEEAGQLSSARLWFHRGCPAVYQ